MEIGAESSMGLSICLFMIFFISLKMKEFSSYIIIIKFHNRM